MTVPCPLTMDDADWQVPAHDAVVYAHKRHRHALVIPVINEGERIRGQLERIKAAHLPVDVIIADGGSTDGSLGPEFMADVGVRTVLTKTGPGKLSAQLRMAYAWCLRQGYAGIVTIDGNGKDGVAAVAEMVARLEDGYDYVQGSRYLPGGAAENTPLERTIANRLISRSAAEPVGAALVYRHHQRVPRLFGTLPDPTRCTSVPRGILGIQPPVLSHCACRAVGVEGDPRAGSATVSR